MNENYFDKIKDVIKVIGPYGLDIKKFNNIFIKYDEEKTTLII